MYAFTREEALVALYEYTTAQGMVNICHVQEILLGREPTEQDVNWARMVARKQRFVGMELVCDPRYEQVLALEYVGGGPMINDQRYGWLCARCGKSYAPSVQECIGCNAHAQQAPVIGVVLPVVPLPGSPTSIPYFTPPRWTSWQPTGESVGASIPC